MAKFTTAASSSSGWGEVLLDGFAYIGDNRNNTTTVGLTRNGEIILASFWRERPPLPSRLYVALPDVGPSAFLELPRILCVVEGLILFRVAIDCHRNRCIFTQDPRRTRSVVMWDCEYFIYHVDGGHFRGIRNPSPVSFRDEDVGLLPRGEQYTVAALVPTPDRTVFTLHLLQSEMDEWTEVKVSVKTPQSEFKLPRVGDACRFFSHFTSTVITIGGSNGTMGWVDLWRGILLCDVLLPNPELRGVSLPLPRAMHIPDGERKVNFGLPKHYRGIAYIKGRHCLRFVDLYSSFQRLPDGDDKRGVPTFRFDGWTITEWRNSKLTSSFDDWEMEGKPVHAERVKLNAPMQQWLDVLPPKPSPQDTAWNLQNLFVFLPTPSMDDSDVVFLIAKTKVMQPESYVLAIDMRNRQLRGLNPFRTEREPLMDVICRHGSMSK